MALSFVLARARTALLVATALGLASCALTPSLSGSRGASATAAPAPPKAAAVPAQPPGALPAPPAPAEVETRPIAPSPAIPVSTSDVIALLLPLESPAYAQAADAVKAGFLAAANRARSASRIRVIGHGDGGVLPAFAAAADARVALIVGPLTRDDLKVVSAMTLVRPRMLALNQTDDGSPLPDNAYALTLSIEGDATLLADVARDNGVRTIAIVASGAPLQRRFAAAFAAAWDPGNPPREYRFDPNPEMLGLLRRELAARPQDAMVLAVEGSDAALAKSFLPPVPIYAVSQIADDIPPQTLRDLEGARYIEIPWLAEPASPVFAGVARANLANPLLERLYALGLDAFALAQMLAEPVPPDRIEFDGATGHLSLMPSHLFTREGRVMLIRDGRAIPDPAAQ